MKIEKTTRLNINTQINGANVNINCEFGESAPAQIQANAYFNAEGQSSAINRTYHNTDGIKFFPVSANVIYPFTAEFDEELRVIIEDIFLNYQNY